MHVLDANAGSSAVVAVFAQFFEVLPCLAQLAQLQGSQTQLAIDPRICSCYVFVICIYSTSMSCEVILGSPHLCLRLPGAY